MQLMALQRGLENHFDSVEVVQDPTTEQLRQKIMHFLRYYGNDISARLLIYYAGHGYTENVYRYNETRGYITGKDTPPIMAYTPAAFNQARLNSISMVTAHPPSRAERDNVRHAN
jgi:hypothetical protein